MALVKRVKRDPLIIFLLINIFFCVSAAFSQKKVGEIEDVGPEKLNKNEQKELIEETLEKGDAYFERGPLEFRKAMEQYMLAYDMNIIYAKTNFKIGRLFLEQNKKFEALNFLRKSYMYDHRVDDNIHYILGYAFQRHDSLGDLDSAEMHYNLHIEEMNLKFTLAERNEKLADVNKRIQECGYARRFMREPDSVSIENLGRNINTNYPEYDPFFIPDFSLLIFTSRRPSTRGGGRAAVDGGYYEDVFESKKSEDEWGPATSFGNKFNPKTNNAVVGLSPDLRTLAFYRDDVGNGDIYLSKIKDNDWSAPKNFRAINSIYRETSISFSSDGNTAYFVSNRPGGIGGKDIYKSILLNKEKEKWSVPENLGSVINSAYDEERVYLHPNGKYLYFSSKGHTSMGGFDVFKSVLIGGKWSDPINLGYPVNSADDDVSFVPSISCKEGYYSAYNPQNGSKDIFLVTFLDFHPDTIQPLTALQPEILDSSESLLKTGDSLITSQNFAKKDSLEGTINSSASSQEKLAKVQSKKFEFSGVIKNPETNKAPADGSVEVINKNTDETQGTALINPTSGEYYLPLMLLPFGVEYQMIIKSGDTIVQREDVILPENGGTVKKDIPVRPSEMDGKLPVTGLRGKIFDSVTNSPIPDCKIELLDKSTGKIAGATRTDDVGGNYFLSNVGLGKDYEMVIKSGEKILKTENISVPFNAGSEIKKDVSVVIAVPELKLVVTTITGNILDPVSKNPISNCTIELIDKATGKVVGKTTPDLASGNYTLPNVVSGMDYELAVKSGDKTLKTENISVPLNASSEIKKNVSVVIPVPETKPVATTITGNILDSVSKKTISNCYLELIDNATGKVVGKTIPDVVSGNYLLPNVANGKNYELAIKSGDKTLKTANISVPANSSSEIKKDFLLVVSSPYSKLTTFKISGVIKDSLSNKPVSNCSVELKEKATGNNVGWVKPDVFTGSYEFPVVAGGKEYEIIVKSGDKLIKTENILAADAEGAVLIKNILVSLNEEEIQYFGKSNLVINPLLFDYDKSELRPESKGLLDGVVKFMMENPKVKIEISGHTDSKGNDVYNMGLAKRRANAAADYLIKNKIIRVRLKIIAKGESQPAAANNFPDGTDNPEGRKNNRRVEIKIISFL